MSFKAKGKKKALSESKTNKHLTLSYKNYLQNWHLPPLSIRHWIKGVGVGKINIF